MSGSDGEEDRRESNNIIGTGERTAIMMDDDDQLAATAKARVDDGGSPIPRSSINRSRRHDDVRRDDAARTLCDANDQEAGKARVISEKGLLRDIRNVELAKAAAAAVAKVCFLH